jgi:hypothetical protein
MKAFIACLPAVRAVAAFELMLPSDHGKQEDSDTSGNNTLPQAGFSVFVDGAGNKMGRDPRVILTGAG